MIAAITGVVGLGGALIGGAFTLAGTREAAEAEAAMQERDLRRVAYVEYIDALDSYATAAASRWATCVPGTDDRLARDVPCHPAVAEFQTSRHVFQGERNDMELIASDEALSLATAIGWTLPNSNVGLTGEAFDDEPVEGTFTLLYDLLLQVAACDTSPNPRDDCPEVRAYVGEETGLELLTDITRHRLEVKPDASTSPLGDAIDRLRERVGDSPEEAAVPD